MQNFIICNAKIITLNAEFIIFNAKIITLNAEFIICNEEYQPVTQPRYFGSVERSAPQLSGFYIKNDEFCIRSDGFCIKSAWIYVERRHGSTCKHPVRVASVAALACNPTNNRQRNPRRSSCGHGLGFTDSRTGIHGPGFTDCLCANHGPRDRPA